MSTRDIHDQLRELYGIELSVEMGSKIMDKILPQVKEWQSRPLPPIYPFVFMDCIHYKVWADGLPSFKEAISAVYPRVQIQRCVIHILRNSFKYVNYSDVKKFSSN